MDVIWEAIKSAWQALCDFLTPIIEGVINVIKTLWDDFKTGLDVIWEAIKTAWNTLCDFLTPVIQPAIDTIKALWDDFKTGLDVIWESIKSGWDDVVDGIKSAWEGIKEPFASVVNWIKDLWQGIKSALKLPHFTFSGSMNPLDWGSQGAPSVGVEWYAKGGIMTQPTLFGMNGNNPMVGGEAGAEAILPLSTLFNQMDSMLSSAINDVSNNQSIALYVTNITQLDGKEISKTTTKQVLNTLNKNTKNSNISKGRGSLIYV